MKQISILGCGWLGLPLAKALLEKGFLVKGSTTSEEKILVLKTAGIIPHIIKLPLASGAQAMDFEKTETDLFLANSEILILDIPPKLRGDSQEDFVWKITSLLPFIEKSTITKVLFVSSTSVYADGGLTMPSITEATMPNPETESGKQLLAVEKLLQDNTHFQSTIVRFGGLIGNDRHPIKFLAGRKNTENPDAPINLIHQEDCIGIIKKIIETNSWNETFNAVAPYHPTRKEYYTQKAILLNLPLPEFDETKTSVGKTISRSKIETVLGYGFKEVML